MKKIGLLILCVSILASMQVLADCDKCEKPENKCQKAEQTCPQTYETNTCNKFLCTNSDIETIFDETGLSDSQICTAKKLQEKYEQETLSVNDRITYEENVLNEYQATCASNSEIRAQKRKIKKLKKTRNEICRCYEKQFKSILSDGQRRAYNKYRK